MSTFAGTSQVLVAVLFSTVEPLITVTSAQQSPPDLRSVKKVPAKFKVKLSSKKPPNSGHLQSTAKRLLRIVPMSNFTSINGQEGDLMQAK